MKNHFIHERPELGHGIVESFHPDGRSFKSVDELMNWIIFGNDKHFYGSPTKNDNGF